MTDTSAYASIERGRCNYDKGATLTDYCWGYGGGRDDQRMKRAAGRSSFSLVVESCVLFSRSSARE